MKQVFLTAALLYLSAIAISQANTKLSNLVAPTTVNASLIPSTANTKDLGTSTLAWKDQYLRGYLILDGTRFVSNAPGTASYNVFAGSNAGIAITTGLYNAVLGHNALYKTTIGSYNSAVGAFALYNNTSGLSNTAVGFRTLFSNTTGIQNTAVGDSALYSNTSGQGNIALGIMALRNNISGNHNVALGNYALILNSTGSTNTAVGISAMNANRTGSQNTSVGSFSLQNITSGAYNTAVGNNSLARTTAAQYNTAVGFLAGFNYDNGWNNVFVGANSDAFNAGFYNVIAIGQGTRCTAPSQVTMGNSATTQYRAYSYWSNISDGRFKKNRKEDVPGLAFINKLRPITYTLDASGLDAYLNNGRPYESQLRGEAKAIMDKALKEKEAIVETGFIAQEVEQAAREVNFNFSGVDAPKNSNDVYGLKYSAFVVPLVKAVQELSRENEALKSNDEELRKEIAELKKMVLEIKKNSTTNSVTSSLGYLEQNTPNPVDGTTTIRYQVTADAGNARITLTNAKGQLIKTVAINNRGIGQIQLNTQALAAGTYNYTLYVDGQQADTKRLVIAR